MLIFSGGFSSCSSPYPCQRVPAVPDERGGCETSSPSLLGCRVCPSPSHCGLGRRGAPARGDFLSHSQLWQRQRLSRARGCTDMRMCWEEKSCFSHFAGGRRKKEGPFAGSMDHPVMAQRCRPGILVQVCPPQAWCVAPGEEGAGVLRLAAPACPGSLPALQWGLGGLMAPSPGEGAQGHLSPVIFFPGFPKELGLKPSPRRGARSHQHPTTGDREEAQSSAWVRGCTPTQKSPRKDFPSPSSASTFSPPPRPPHAPRARGAPGRPELLTFG